MGRSESAAGLREEERDGERKFHRFRRRRGKPFEDAAARGPLVSRVATPFREPEPTMHLRSRSPFPFRLPFLLSFFFATHSLPTPTDRYPFVTPSSASSRYDHV